MYYSLTLDNSYITYKDYAQPIFEQNKQYIVQTNNGSNQFGDINDALLYARRNKNSNAIIKFASNDKIIWNYDDVTKF